MRRWMVGLVLFILVSVLSTVLFLSSLGTFNAEARPGGPQPQQSLAVSRPIVASVSPSKAVLMQGGEVAVVVLQGIRLSTIGSIKVSRSGAQAEGIEISLDKSQLPDILKISLKAGSTAQVATDYLLTIMYADGRKFVDVPNTILSIEVVAAKTEPSVLRTERAPEKQIAGQKKDAQIERAILDIQDFQRKGIDWKTLPDSQLIRIGNDTKSVADIKKAQVTAKVRNERAALEISEKVQAEFAARQVALHNQHEARLAQRRWDLEATMRDARRAHVEEYLNKFYEPGQLVNPPGPPVLESIDTTGGPPSYGFKITGKNFQVLKATSFWTAEYVKPKVIFEMSRGVREEALCDGDYWSDTAILAYVPEVTGYPESKVYMWVETECGKSEPIPFQFEPRMDLIPLPCSEENELTMVYNITPCNALDSCNEYSTDYVRLDTPCYRDVWAGTSFASDAPPHLVVKHATELTIEGCSGIDEFWQGMKLINGWTVSDVRFYKITESNDVSATLANSPVNTDNPLVQVEWKMNGINAFIECSYYVCVYITGPAGLPWK